MRAPRGSRARAEGFRFTRALDMTLGKIDGGEPVGAEQDSRRARGARRRRARTRQPAGSGLAAGSGARARTGRIHHGKRASRHTHRSSNSVYASGTTHSVKNVAEVRPPATI